ncbi:hypothetical protein RHMOL_Rhmol06G0023900 [Rhododendron molle]|uniref:Uncharacterized protein n=1 Tax=Rhododendron molle TaxID=49168 RepID=A0ACC0N9X1_RHOML|nr:hypothetical protein RHMOL_Rhmol06G0023900 [Rhododendron molle]
MKVKASWLSDRFTGQVKEGAELLRARRAATCCCFWGKLYLLTTQVWAWERLPYLAPGRLGKRAPKAGAPLIGRWDDVFHTPDLATHLVGAYRYHLDIQRPDEVRTEVCFNTSTL